MTSDRLPERAARKPLAGQPTEVMVRRYRRGYRGIDGINTLPGGGLVSAPIAAKQFVLEGEFTRKQFDYFGRDADLDGRVQDGTPWERRSRTLSHLSLRRTLKLPNRRSRLRDMDYLWSRLAERRDEVPGTTNSPQQLAKFLDATTERLSQKRLLGLGAQEKAARPKAGRTPIAKGRLVADSPGIRDALSRGAVVDELGHLRCPPGTPGAMQFTNWKLAGCAIANPKRLRKPMQTLMPDDLAILKKNGRVLSSADISIQRAGAIRSSRLQTPGKPVKRKISEVLRSRRGKDSPTKLERIFLRASKEGKPVRLDLSSAGDLERGYMVPRNEGIDIRYTDLFDSDGKFNEAGLAGFVDYLSKTLDDPSPREGAKTTAITISRRDRVQREDGTWARYSPPYSVEAKPLEGRAQELANEAGGDFSKFMGLLDSEGYVIFDFETTGLGEYGNLPVQVSAIRYQNGKEVERMNIFMNPGRSISPWTSQNVRRPGGKDKFVNDEWLAQQVPLKDGLQQLSDFIGTSIIGAHNIAYDRDTVLKPLIEQYGIKFDSSGSFDTMPMARQLIPNEVVKSKSLSSLSDAFDVKLKEAHSADQDSQATDGILRAMMAWASENDGARDIFDAALQEERVQKAVERYEKEMKEFNDGSVIRIDLVDVFPDDGKTPAKRQKELDAALDAARESGAPFVTSAWNSQVFDVSGDQAYSFMEMVNPEDPTARIVNAKTSLDRAFARLDGKDNMNLDNFTNEEVKTMLELFVGVPGFEWVDRDNPEHLYKALDQGANNLTQLMQSVSPKDRAQFALWYDSANVFANDLGLKYGIAPESASAVIAALSPTQDWNQNIALAEHVIKFVKDKDFRISEEFAGQLHMERMAKYQKTLSNGEDGNLAKIRKKRLEIQSLEGSLPSAGEDEAKEIEKKIGTAENSIRGLQAEYDRAVEAGPPLVAEFVGKSFDEVGDEYKPLVIQRHAKWYGGEYMGQTINPEKGAGLYAYRMTPKVLEGTGDGQPEIGYDLNRSEPNKARVQSISQYKSALAIISGDQDGKPDVAAISKSIGKGSKVRSFYNNIMYPRDGRYMDWTSDTHAFGAATLIPVTASHKALDMMFDPRESTGTSKAYPLFRAMGILAADRWNAQTGEDLLPRQVQSITWEAIRRLVPTEYRKPSDPTRTVSDTSLKSFTTNTMAQIAQLTSGDKPRRPDLVGRQVELLQELVDELIPASKGDRAAVELAWRKRYELSEAEKPDMPREIKQKDDGTWVAKDAESGKYYAVETGVLTPDADAVKPTKGSPKRSPRKPVGEIPKPVDSREEKSLTPKINLAEHPLANRWLSLVSDQRDRDWSSGNYFYQPRQAKTISGHKVHISSESTDEIKEVLQRLLPILDADEAMTFKLATEDFFTRTAGDHAQKGKGVTIYLPRVQTVEEDIAKIVGAMEGWKGSGRSIEGDEMLANGVGRRYELREPITQEIDMKNDADRYARLYVPANEKKALL